MKSKFFIGLFVLIHKKITEILDIKIPEGDQKNVAENFLFLVFVVYAIVLGLFCTYASDEILVITAFVLVFYLRHSVAMRSFDNVTKNEYE
jgi:hypothetical protein